MLISHRILPIVAARLYFLESADRDPNLYLADIFTQAAMNFALMSECALGLKPFLQAFHDEYGLSTGVVRPYNSNPSMDPYSELSNTTDSNARAKARAAVARQASYDQADSAQSRKKQRRQSGNIKLRGDIVGLGTDAACSAVPDRSSRTVHEFEDDVELLPRPDGIQRKTTVTVAIESGQVR
jgi:hypothetical protein